MKRSNNCAGSISQRSQPTALCGQGLPVGGAPRRRSALRGRSLPRSLLEGSKGQSSHKVLLDEDAETTGGIAAMRPSAAFAPYIWPVIAVESAFMNTGIVIQSLRVSSKAIA